MEDFAALVVCPVQVSLLGWQPCGSNFRGRWSTEGGLGLSLGLLLQLQSHLVLSCQSLLLLSWYVGIVQVQASHTIFDRTILISVCPEVLTQGEKSPFTTITKSVHCLGN